MDYQPTGNTPDPSMNQAPEPAMAPVPAPEPGHANSIWYVIGAAVIIALGLWYFYGTQAPVASPESSAVDQTQIPAPSSGNTTADISADLSQIPDTSAALDADAAASADAVSSF